MLDTILYLDTFSNYIILIPLLKIGRSIYKCSRYSIAPDTSVREEKHGLMGEFWASQLFRKQSDESWVPDFTVIRRTGAYERIVNDVNDKTVKS